MQKTLSAISHIIAAELLSKSLSLRLVGWFCRYVLRRRIATAILFYPANKGYMESVTYPWYALRVQWAPCFGGFYSYKGSVGLIFAIGAYEQEFSEPDNVPKLLAVHERMVNIGRLSGAESVAYSGVLPGILPLIGVRREPIENIWTAHWVVMAIDELQKRMNFSSDVPIVVIGSAGFLGSKVVQILKKQTTRLVLEIDPQHSDPSCHGPHALNQLYGTSAILVNISRRHVIDAYVEHLWPGVVVLNEVYPECSDEVLRSLKKMGARYFHLQGIQAWSIPKFPGAYAGAIPCCAASASENSFNQSGGVELMLLEK